MDKTQILEWAPIILEWAPFSLTKIVGSYSTTMGGDIVAIIFDRVFPSTQFRRSFETMFHLELDNFNHWLFVELNFFIFFHVLICLCVFYYVYSFLIFNIL